MTILIENKIPDNRQFREAPLRSVTWEYCD